jgi:hypothetical protein
MQVVCAKCSRVLSFSGERPSFCGYCGQPLGSTGPVNTPVHDPDAPTQTAVVPIAREAAEVPQTVGGYRLLRELGSGGMGAVYEAEETATGRRVALKLIAPEFVRSPDAVERFRQEGRIASLVAHPRCVFVLAVDEEAGRPYIVMELMPGATLKDLVDRQGPLPPEQAIAKILDVIEGLREAHRLDVIHRDVKPSNCFLEADGRVKVGDFGLAKSLVKDAHLTKTGAFVGTPHFASPEQVRGDPIDARTDVYSTAATLYYLLTGTPPFHGSDSRAALARILTDPLPSLRKVRPELSPALERVILRGLERDRERRWPDLEAFRQALLALAPGPLTWADQGPRLAAYLFDYLLLWLIGVGAGLALAPVLRAGLDSRRAALAQGLAQVVCLVVFLLYFAVPEHLAGASPGKRLLRLRVSVPPWADPPAWGPALARTAVFYGLVQGGFPVGALLSVLAGDPAPSLTGLVAWGWFAAGSALVLVPMRARNGYQGLHEILSGTRVIRLAEPVRRQALQGSGGWLLSFLLSRRLDRSGAQAGGLPERLAGFAVRGALKWTPAEKVLLGEDASLGRRVFLWLRPQSEPPLDVARRDVGRRTRLRWLAGGRQGDLQWDAILAPSGCPLPEFIRSEGSLAWPEARPLLRELAGELAAACADKTLPRALSPAQVWVQADGRVQLADTTLTMTLPTAEAPAPLDEQRALALLRHAAVLVLEGRLPGPGEEQAAVRVALPEDARRFVNRLLGVERGFTGVQQVQAELASRDPEAAGLREL